MLSCRPLIINSLETYDITRMVKSGHMRTLKIIFIAHHVQLAAEEDNTLALLQKECLIFWQFLQSDTLKQ
jgi:hypothetical protein